MNVKLFTLATFLLFFLHKCLSSYPLDMIVSFVKLDNRPTSLLVPNLCWGSHKLIDLSKRFSDIGISITTSLQPNRTEYVLQHLLIIVDMSCPDVERFLIQASTEEYFKAPYRWLLLNDEPSASNYSVLDDIDIQVDSDVVLAERIHDQKYMFREAYKISEHSEVIYTNRASWTSTNSLPSTDTSVSTSLPTNIKFHKYGWTEDYRNSIPLPVRRNDLRGRMLTVMNVITDSNETRIHLTDRLNLHQDFITKMSYLVIRICFEMMNATERLEFTHTWGYKDKNGQFERKTLIDQLIKKEVDLGTLTIFTTDRSFYIDYIAMVGSTSIRLVFREPPLSHISNIFTLPFSWTVWLAILVCCLGCSVFLYITSRWEATMSMHPLQLDGSWADVLILMIGAVLQQGCTLEPRYAAGRCVTLILFVALTILYAAYSANIVVLLRAPSSSIRTLTDLLNSPLTIAAGDFEYNRYFFKRQTEPIRKAIYEKKIEPPGKKANYYSMAEGVERIRKGLFAFHMELVPGYRLIQNTYREDEKCDLVEIDYTNIISPWVPGQRRAPLKDLYKINFLHIRESGVQDSIYRRVTVPKPKCSGTLSSFSSVGITDMYPALMMTMYGMLLAPAVLAIEILYTRLMNIRAQKKNLVYEDTISLEN